MQKRRPPEIIKLSPDLRAALKELAAADDVSLSSLVTILLSEALASRLRAKC
jgi:hypothetical protein